MNPQNHVANTMADHVLLHKRYHIRKDSVVGEGSSGRVFRGLDSKTGKEVAVKIYVSTEDKYLQDFKRTIHLSSLLHEHLASTVQTATGRGRRASCSNALVESALKDSGIHANLSDLLVDLNISSCFPQVLDHSRDIDGPGVDDASGLLFVIQELGGVSLEEKLQSYEGGDVRNTHLGNNSSMTASEIKDLCWSLVCITFGLHACGYVHLDIKPLNIVEFKGEGHSSWKLIDLDGAVLANSPLDVASDNFTFTQAYMAPEIARAINARNRPTLLDKRSASKSKSLFSRGKKSTRLLQPELVASRIMDVWSVAMCIIQSIFLTPLLEAQLLQWREETGNDEKFMEWLGDYTTEPLIQGEVKDLIDYVDEDLSVLLQSMLKKDPKERICMATCLTHHYFQDRWDRMVRGGSKRRSSLCSDQELDELLEGRNAVKGAKSAACTMM
eukprot:TRINITY_DN87387_c0_g1_i1.p1 TRINITY_DN87387_c0_g1~~TRINITY_DN87387_c0_g1_i1.p1  ORF type:complete len:442 (+),score=86.45 TRINITY_DN87387_c0_g1_i1:61-1386(+)